MKIARWNLGRHGSLHSRNFLPALPPWPPVRLRLTGLQYSGDILFDRSCLSNVACTCCSACKPICSLQRPRTLSFGLFPTQTSLFSSRSTTLRSRSRAFAYHSSSLHFFNSSLSIRFLSFSLLTPSHCMARFSTALM
jgi:hypothetical protein